MDNLSVRKEQKPVVDHQSIIGDLVAADYKCATVFSAYGIDFCCRGNKTIQEVSIQKDISPTVLIDRLKRVMSEDNREAEMPYNQWPLDALADHIIRVHHAYIQENAPILMKFLDKLCKVHGERHPELLEIRALFQEAVSELQNHMLKEEKILFPLIMDMVNPNHNNPDDMCSVPGNLHQIINVMHADHDREGERFRKIELLSDSYMAPEDACTTYRVAFDMLKEFEADLHMHIHLENNILFPKALQFDTMKNKAEMN